MQRKNLGKNEYGWLLYDFANSIAAVIGGVYFSKWYIEDLGASPIAFNSLLIFSALLIIVLSSRIGRAVDREGVSKWLIVSTALSGAALLSLAVAANTIDSVDILYILTFVLFLGFMFFYQFSRVCHNSYLKVHTESEIQERLSGLGSASNWLGSVIGIAITIPIVSSLPGEEGREATFWLAAGCFFVLSFIAIRMLSFGTADNEVQKLDDATKPTALAVFLVPSVVAFFLFFDAMATIQKNLPPFLTEVFGMDDDTQGIAFLLILLAAALGGFLASKYVKYGTARRSIIYSGTMLSAAIALIAFGSSPSYWIAFPIAGLAYGVLESAIRVSFMEKMSPSKAGSRFAILAAVERASGVAGPALWSIPFLFFNSDSAAFVAAMWLMFILVCIAVLIVTNKRFGTE